MPIPARDVVLDAIKDRLAALVGGLVVERGRRSPVDPNTDTLPLAALTGTDWTPDETVEPGSTHYTLGFNVTTTVTAPSDGELDAAQSAIHADIIGALVGWTPDVPGVGDVVEGETEFLPVDDEDSSKPLAEVSSNFTILVVLPRGQLWLS